MNETDSSNDENRYGLEIWKSWPPEEVLEAFINELKSPLTSIKGWVEILRMDGSKEVQSRALDSISKIIEKIEKVEDEVKEYLDEQKRKSDSAKTS